MAQKIKTKYGLLEEVRFCTKCVVSNQRPNSAVEHKHTINTKKQTIHIDDEGVCDACANDDTGGGVDGEEHC